MTSSSGTHVKQAMESETHVVATNRFGRLIFSIAPQLGASGNPFTLSFADSTLGAGDDRFARDTGYIRERRAALNQRMYLESENHLTKSCFPSQLIFFCSCTANSIFRFFSQENSLSPEFCSPHPSPRTPEKPR